MPEDPSDDCCVPPEEHVPEDWKPVSGTTYIQAFQGDWIDSGGER